MYKFLVFIFIIIIAIVLGAVYGILHDQLTYTISEEYYTKFKFIQFNLENWGLGSNIGTDQNPEIQLYRPRLGAGLVGLLATWWVGLIIGVVLAFLGLIHNTAKEMFIVTFKSFLLTITIAFLTGLVGLLYGKLFLTATRPNWFFPKNLNNIDNFIMVGSMHNFSYLGGLIGLVIAILYSIKQKIKFKQQTSQ